MAKKKSSTIFSLYILILLCFIILSFFGEVSLSKSILKLSVLIAKIFLVIFITTTIHELGHLIMGIIFKYKFVSFSTLFFNFYIQNDKIKFRFIIPKTFFGYCSMYPVNVSIRNILLYISGGVILNIITGIIFGIISMASDVWSNFFLILFVISLLFALLNAIPIKKASLYKSDGTIIWDIILKRKDRDELIEEIEMQNKHNDSLRPRDFPAELDKNKEMNCLEHIPFYFKALDSGDIDTMQYCSDKIEKDFDKADSITFIRFCYIICHTAYMTGDLEKAKKYYEKGKKQIDKDDDCNGLRVRAYYEYYVNRNSEHSLELCQQGLAVVDKFVHKGFAKMEKDLLLKLQEQINATR